MTYTAPLVTGPAANPWDTESIASRALDVLRLDPADRDASRIADCATTAGQLIDGELDRVTPYPAGAIPSAVVGAAVNLTVTLYRLKDAAFGILDTWSADGVVARIPADVLKGVHSMLADYRERRGIA